MRLEEKLNLRLAMEEVEGLDTPEQVQDVADPAARQRYSTMFDTIQQLLDLPVEDLLDFAEQGGTVEEGKLIIPNMRIEALSEGIIKREVQTGNYTRTLEIEFMGGSSAHRGYVVVGIGEPNDKVEGSLQKRLEGWVPGQPTPFPWFPTEEDALKMAGKLEAKLAREAGQPAKPPKAAKQPKANVRQAASSMARRMNRVNISPEIAQASREQLMQYAKMGKQASTDSTWKMAKYIFLSWLALSAFATGIAGVAALIVGYYIVKGIDHARQSQPPQI